MFKVGDKVRHVWEKEEYLHEVVGLEPNSQFGPALTLKAILPKENAGKVHKGLEEMYIIISRTHNHPMTKIFV